MELCLPNLECIGRAFALIVGDRHHDAEHSSTVSKNWEELQKKIEEGARAQLWIRIFKKKKNTRIRIQNHTMASYAMIFFFFFNVSIV